MDADERNQWRDADRVFQTLIDLDERDRRKAIDSANLEPAVMDKLKALLDSDRQNHWLLDGDTTEFPWRAAAAEQAVDGGDDNIGRCIGDWRLIERIGRGGMATVYRARRVGQDFEQLAAVKLLSVALHSAAQQARFRRERQILASLHDPNIAGLIDAGLDNSGTPYLAMSLVNGERIDKYCEQQNLSIRQRVELLLQVCSAVVYAHRQLVIHRDIKPGNILVDERGHVTLLDFGIARLLDDDDTRETTVTQAFTPDYAAPEQRAIGQVLGTAVDVYGVGAVLYRVLTGKPPVHDRHGETIAASITARQRGDTHAAARLRGDLDSILGQALCADPQRRYAGVDTLAADLRAWLQHRPLQARRTNTWMRLQKFVRRNRAAGVLATLVVLVGAAGLIAFVLSDRALRRRAVDLQAVTQFQTDMLQRVVPRDVGTRLHEALKGAVEQTDPETAKTLHAAIARIDYTGLANRMLDEALLHRSVVSARKIFAKKPRIEGTLLQQLAIDYRGLGMLRQAKTIQDETTTLLRKKLGEGDRLTLMSMREKLKLARRTDLPNGEAMHRKVLALHVHYLGADDLDTERARGALAQWLMSHGKAKEAESLLRKVATRIEQLKGDADPDAVATRINLAFAISAQGDYKRSLPYLRRAESDATREFGAEGAFTLTLRENLAWVLNRTGHPYEAEALYYKVYEARRRLLGAKHHSTLLSLNNYAVLLRKHGKAAKAEPLQSEAYLGLRDDLGPDHPNTLRTGMNLARDYLALHEYDKAVKLLQLTAAGLKMKSNRRALAQAQRLLGHGLQGQGHVNAAKRAYQESWNLAAATKRVAEQRKAAKALVALYTGPDSDAEQRALWQARLRQLNDAVAGRAN